MTSMYHELIERLDMFFLATADADGRPNCSYKGGDPDWARDVLARNDPARDAPQPV